MFKFIFERRFSPLKGTLTALSCLAILFSACKKDNASSNSILPSLSESVWKGTLITNASKSRSQVNLNVEFRTSTTGYFVLSEIPFNDVSSYAGDSPFTFKQDGKTLSIDGGFKNALLGEWISVKSQSGILTLVREISNPAESDTLKIIKSN